MKLKTIFILIILFFSTPAIASTMDEIQNKTKEIAVYGDIQENAWEIIWFVNAKVNYEWHRYPQNVYQIWHDNKGDCTDRAIIMLSQIYVPSVPMHGYCNGSKHDYLKYKINGVHYIDTNDCENLTYVETGYW